MLRRSGLSGEKTYEVTFVFTAERLVERDLKYTRLEMADTPTETIKFDDASQAVPRQ